MNETQHHSGVTLATRVTILRIMGIPVFVLLTLYYIRSLQGGAPVEWLRISALAVFVLVAATDALDGYLARSRNEITRLGKVLDPLADKSLLLAALILLTRPSVPELHPHLPIWFTGLVISRDVVLIAGSLLIHHFIGEVDVRPRLSGKAATFLTMVAITWVLAQASALWFNNLIYLTGFLILFSGLQYVLDGVRQMESIARH
jgi:CDP-diacylglycerol--glycerol-3-phosphate 3-phosphatidyltransferase